VDGQIVRQSSSYRRGLVLGLTMAEVMILLIFCLLIALAAVLRTEMAKLAEAKAAPTEQGVSQNDREVLREIKKNQALYDRMLMASTSSHSKQADEFWRDLFEGQSLAEEYRNEGLTPEQAHAMVASAKQLQAKGVDAKTALRDVDIVAKIQTVMPRAASPSTPVEKIIDVVQRGLNEQSKAGHQWPPIISLSEANGHYFKTGSAELSPEFKFELTNETPARIVELIKQYDVDVIEVVGHTDEQRISSRPSNLDGELLPVLRNAATVSNLVPADNAGLGLARAVSVLSVLRQSPLLQDYKLIPLSGAQLVNTDETLAISGNSGDIPQRRRIEIRLRKSSPKDTTATIEAVPAPKPKPVRRPKPKLTAPLQAPSSSSPLSLGPFH
jgi:outer membrane protein OmpA-like peptidoglycan-associated protein